MTRWNFLICCWHRARGRRRRRPRGPADPDAVRPHHGGGLEPRGLALDIYPEPLLAGARYEVELSTAITDAAGHPLAPPLGFSFETGDGDTSAPAVAQTLPADRGLVGTDEPLGVYFSEALDPRTIGPATVRVYDETAGGTEAAIDLDTRHAADPGPRAWIEIDPDPDQGGGWEAGHDYRLALGADLTDLAGNPLAGPRDWHFTAVPAGPAAPPRLSGAGDCRASRLPAGRVTLELALAAAGTGATLSVAAEDLTQPGKVWTDFTLEDGRYRYRTPAPADEALVTGPHRLRFNVTDPANGQQRVLEQTVQVLAAVPELAAPADEATDVAVESNLDFTTALVPDAAGYRVTITEADTGAIAFNAAVLPNRGSAYRVTVPAARALHPDTRYSWTVTAVDALESEFGRALSEERGFRTAAAAASDWHAVGRVCV